MPPTEEPYIIRLGERRYVIVPDWHDRLGDAVEVVPVAERDRLREEVGELRYALEEIANQNSGHWGWIAHEALTRAGRRPEGSSASASDTSRT